MTIPTREQQPSPPPEREAPFCPRCGVETEPSQEYCLSCGLRLDAPGAVEALRRGWLTRLGWDPGERLLTVLLALLVAAAGAGLAIAFAPSDGGPSTLVATSRVTSQAVPSATITTAPTATLPTATTPTQTQTAPRPRPRTPISWPAGTNGYTVVLNSIPRTPTGRTNALAQARAALRRGLAQVGVLDSSRFASLHPGYWVVFTGVFRSFDAAQGRISQARAAGFQLAYVRQITA